MIFPTPNSKAIHSIEASIVSFMNRNTYFRTNKDLTFRERKYGGLGILELNTHIKALQLGQMRHTFTSSSYWLQLLSDGIPSKRYRNPNELLSFRETTLTKTVQHGKNRFWKNVWSNWHEVGRKYRLEKGPTLHRNPPRILDILQ